MKGLTPSFVLSILETSYRKQVSSLSLYIKRWLHWNQLTERFGFQRCSLDQRCSFRCVLSPISARVFVFCKWNEISYLNQLFAEELNSIKLPTCYHNALNIHLPEIASISLATRSSSFVGIPRLQLSSRLNEFYFVLVLITQRGPTLLADDQCSDVHSLK